MQESEKFCKDFLDQHYKNIEKGFIDDELDQVNLNWIKNNCSCYENDCYLDFEFTLTYEDLLQALYDCASLNYFKMSLRVEQTLWEIQDTIEFERYRDNHD